MKHIFKFILIRRKDINLEPYWVLLLDKQKDFDEFMSIKRKSFKDKYENGVHKHCYEDLDYTHQDSLVYAIMQTTLLPLEITPKKINKDILSKLYLSLYPSIENNFLQGYIDMFNTHKNIVVNFKDGCMRYDLNVFDVLDSKTEFYDQFPMNSYILKVSKFLNGSHWYAKIGDYEVRDKKGKGKWNTYNEAKAACKWFLKKYGFELIEGITYKLTKPITISKYVI